MYKSQIKTKRLDIGQSIEEQVRLAETTNAPIEAISPMIYTDSKDGVRPEFDIRTDRQELALDAIDHYQGSEIAKTDFMAIDNDKDHPSYEELANESLKTE